MNAHRHDEAPATALYWRVAPVTPSHAALRGEARTETAVIGGGLTGLGTALALAEAGRAVTVLEANQPGWGASGRNGGQLNPGLKDDPSEILRIFGPEHGARLVQFGWSTVDATAALISRLGIDCDLRRNGTIRAALREGDVAAVRRSREDMVAQGMPVDWLEGPDLARLTGHAQYRAGFLDRRGGDVDPLKFTRGLAAAVVAAGGIVMGDSPALRLSRADGAWHIATPGGVLRAERVVVCCNGYADGLVPGLKRALVPVFSSVLATAPLPAEIAGQVMPGRQSLYESGLVTTYCRVDSTGRLVIGGRGPQRPVSRAGAIRAVGAWAHRLWPALRGVPWDCAWNGRVAVTPDHLPHVHDLGGGLVTAYGFNGRGVALSSTLGRAIGGILAQDGDLSDLPLPPSALKTVPFHRFWKLGVHATIALSRAKQGLNLG